MCGRFTITLTPEELTEELGLNGVIQSFQPRFNVAPTQLIPIIRDSTKRMLEMFHWGLIPSWSKETEIGKKMINARSETIQEKPSFRNAFAKRRCLIPADGFFEWKKSTGEKGKTPFFFELSPKQAFVFAGIFEIWTAPDGSNIPTCSIITCPANDLVAQVHDRMPVILPRDKMWHWLDPKKSGQELKDMLLPLPAYQMTVRPISTLVNNPALDSPEILNEVLP